MGNLENKSIAQLRELQREIFYSQDWSKFEQVHDMLVLREVESIDMAINLPYRNIQKIHIFGICVLSAVFFMLIGAAIAMVF